MAQRIGVKDGIGVLRLYIAAEMCTLNVVFRMKGFGSWNSDITFTCDGQKLNTVDLQVGLARVVQDK